MTALAPLQRTAWPVVLLLLPAALAAQPAPPLGEGAARSVRLAIDNDLIALRGPGPPPDHDYTHGTRATIAWDAAPDWLRHAAGGSGAAARCRTPAGRGAGCLTTALALGQEIYTPRRDAPRPVSGERPYAGWLHFTAAATRVTPGRSRTLAATLGVTGPPSLAREVQDGVHRLLGNAPQLGWAHQLPTTVGAALEYAAVRRATRALGTSAVSALRADWGATIGTHRSRAGGGVELVLGRGVGGGWTPIEPEVERPPRLYLLVAARQDWVPHDAFVEGRGGTPGGARRPFVGQLELGVGHRWRTLAVEYRHLRRGREYGAQPAAHAVGSVRVSAYW